jgi:hypothetical protein
VKVNVLEIKLSFGVGVNLPSGFGNAPAVEERLQAWLKDNPSAQIEHVVQTPVAMDEGGTATLLVTIFYRD